ncbi:MAG: hypothetical protein ACFFD9_06275 [Candidatus Thorarchaeota archaeon]
MSDADVFDSTALDTAMKGHSRLVVILGDSQTVKDSARKLRNLVRIVRVARGVLLIHGQIGKDQSILQDLPVISFQKAREIPSASDRGEEATSRRVYAVVSYRFKSPTAIQKKRVERLVRRSVSIRLRPGVLLFPVLRSKDRRRLFESDQTDKFLDSKKASEELRSLGADVSRWSRLRLVEHQSEVKDALTRTLLQDITSFEELVKDLRARAKDSEAQDKTLKKRYSTLSRRYRKMKMKWSLASKIWHYDATKMLTRSYNMLIAARRIIESSIGNSRER